MKVRSLVAALGKLENLLRRAGETDGSRSVNQFIPLFQGYDGETVASFVTKLTKRKPPLGQATISPPVQQLRAVLTGFEEVLRDAEAPRSADDIAKLCDILDQCGQASIDQLVRDGREWLLPTPKLLPAPKPVKTSRSKKAPAASVPTMAPSAYAASLTEATPDNARFDAVIEQLRADKTIKPGDMCEIARVYLRRDTVKKKTRTKALEDIISRQAVEARQDSRASLLDRLKPW